ncbi:Crp/Fnr family transcriptional regulator [Niallia sp. 01092]|uniref:Crp/Fnr family transcriptional regulator n=1 Tax=unclassified Niallia TaxID=2837522 RepID=UPI003FD0DAD8
MNSQDINKLLSEFSLFKELDNRELARIVEIGMVRTFKKGSHVFLQGEPLKNTYFIFDGKVKVYRTDLNGKEQIVAVLKKGEMFPHVGFFRKGGYPAFAKVQEEASLVVIPIQEFEKVLIDNPELCIKVFKVLGEKIVDLQDRLGEQILNNTYQQIIKLLIRLSKTHGKKLEDGFVLLTGEFTNKDLANMIGTTRETVSRTFTKLKKEQLIRTYEGDIIIHPDKLLDRLFQ